MSVGEDDGNDDVIDPVVDDMLDGDKIPVVANEMPARANEEEGARCSALAASRQQLNSPDLAQQKSPSLTPLLVVVAHRTTKVWPSVVQNLGHMEAW